VVEALELAFAAAAPGTPAECAELIVERVPVECECDQCGAEFHPSDVIYVCPYCGAISSRVHQGRELELASLEVD
jgi:hydrogenase nickel incorporation protein HypA/HybF